MEGVPVEDWETPNDNDHDVPGGGSGMPEGTQASAAEAPADAPSGREIYFALPRDFFIDEENMALSAINSLNRQAVAAATLLMFIFDSMDQAVAGSVKFADVKCEKNNQFNHAPEPTTFDFHGTPKFRIATQFETIFSKTGYFLGFRLRLYCRDDTKDFNSMAWQRVERIRASRITPQMPAYLKLYSRGVFFDQVSVYLNKRLRDIVDRPAFEAFTFDAATAFFSGICDAQKEHANYAGDACPFKLGISEKPSPETARMFEKQLFPRRIGCQSFIFEMSLPSNTRQIEEAFAVADAAAALNPDLMLICDREGVRLVHQTIQSRDFLDGQFSSNREILNRLKGEERQTEMKNMMRKLLKSCRNESMVRSKGSEMYVAAIKHIRNEKKTFRITMNDCALDLTPRGNAIISLVTLSSAYLKMRDGEILRNFFILLAGSYSCCAPAYANQVIHAFLMDAAAAGKTYLQDALKDVLLHVIERSSATLASLTTTSNDNFCTMLLDECNPEFFGLGAKNNAPSPAARALTDFFKQIMTAGYYIATHGAREGDRASITSLILATISVQAALNTRISYNDLISNPSLNRVVVMSNGGYYKSTSSIGEAQNNPIDENDKQAFLKDMKTIHAMYALIAMMMKAGIMDWVEEGMTSYMLEQLEQKIQLDKLDPLQERQKIQIKNMSRVFCQISAIIMVLGGGAFRTRNWSVEDMSEDARDEVLIEFLCEMQKMLVVSQQDLIFTMSLLETQLFPIREHNFIYSLGRYFQKYPYTTFSEPIPGQMGCIREISPLVVYDVEYSVLLRDLVKSAKLPEHVIHLILQRLLHTAVSTSRSITTTIRGSRMLTAEERAKETTHEHARTKVLEIIMQQGKPKFLANQRYLNEPYEIPTVTSDWVKDTLIGIFSTCSAITATYASFFMLFFPMTFNESVPSGEPVPYGFNCLTIEPNPHKAAILSRPNVFMPIHEICLGRKPRRMPAVVIYKDELETEFLRKHYHRAGLPLEDVLSTKILSGRAVVENGKRTDPPCYKNYMNGYIADSKRRCLAKSKIKLLTPEFINANAEKLAKTGAIHSATDEFAENELNFDDEFNDLVPEIIYSAPAPIQSMGSLELGAIPTAPPVPFSYWADLVNIIQNPPLAIAPAESDAFADVTADEMNALMEIE